LEDSDSNDHHIQTTEETAQCSSHAGPSGIDKDSENKDHSSTQMSDALSKRARKELLTPRLAAALDKCKISDRDSVHILTACLDALNVNLREYIINRTSIKRGREKFRKQVALGIKYNFNDLQLNYVVIHWDSKMLPDFTGKETVDRLPVIATGFKVEQLLGVPELTSGTGLEISSAVYDTLQEWSLQDTVQAFVFDTTASNTGRLNGACYLLEQKLNRDIMFLTCRHHIYEIVLHGVFNKIQLTPNKGPDIPLFKRFQKQWKLLNQTQYLPWDSDAIVLKILKDDADRIIQYVQNKIKEAQPRHDYLEFLELVLIFLGQAPSTEILFRQPGAYHWQDGWERQYIH